MKALSIIAALCVLGAAWLWKRGWRVYVLQEGQVVHLKSGEVITARRHAS